MALDCGRGMEACPDDGDPMPESPWNDGNGLTLGIGPDGNDSPPTAATDSTGNTSSGVCVYALGNGCGTTRYSTGPSDVERNLGDSLGNILFGAGEMLARVIDAAGVFVDGYCVVEDRCLGDRYRAWAQKHGADLDSDSYLFGIAAAGGKGKGGASKAAPRPGPGARQI
jgi:hypothetical protein